MSEERKQKLREARYKKVYGDNWREVVAQKAAQPVKENKLPGKREFLEMLIVKMADEDCPATIWADLARLYVEVKKWIGQRPRPGRIGRPPMTTTATSEELGDINEEIVRIEEARRAKVKNNAR